MQKKSLSSFAVRRFVQEANAVEGAYFHKAYQIDYDTLVLRFAIRRDIFGEAPSRGRFKEQILRDEDAHDDEVKGISLGEGGGSYIKFDLYFKMGGFIFVTSQVGREMPKEPSPFAMKLRKSLDNRILRKVEQVGMDRLVVLTFAPFSEGEEEWKLYLELFGDGNAILVKGNRIEAPFTSKSWSSRTVKRGEEFLPPPSGIDAFELDKSGMKELMEGSKEDLVRFLIKRCNLPPVYAEEVCSRAGLDKKTDPSGLDEEGLTDLFLVFRELMEEVLNGEKAYVHFMKEQPILIEPTLLGSFFDAKDIPDAKERFSEDATRAKGDFFMEMLSINQALELYMFEGGSVKEVRDVTRKERKIQKIEAMMVSQVKALSEREKEAVRFKEQADALYFKYQEIDELLKGFDKMEYEMDNSSFPKVEELVQGPGGTFTLKVRLETESGEDVLELDPNMDINQNADILYSKSKTARRKMEGIEKALSETRKKLANAKKEAEDEEDDITGSSNHRVFWFEAYRWCFSSEEILMIGGRDAKSNERVVKKYMRDCDIYAHADISGAASVVVRGEKEKEIGERTREEACHFSVLNSKAWNAAIGSVGAYWVLPDQVSRTPQSGEFLAKGSFVIRGKKNFVEKLPLEGAAGTVYIEGVPKIMFGPERSVMGSCTGTYFKLRPGKTKKSDIAKVIASELGGELDQVMSVLPAGNMDMTRVRRGEGDG
ncbi:MAG: ribosome rescue protein RqcH [Thermoplasmatota archaeon]